MPGVNLGRVQGGGFYGSTSTSEINIPKNSVIASESIRPLIGDTIVNANGAFCKILAITSTSYTVSKYGEGFIHNSPGGGDDNPGNDVYDLVIRTQQEFDNWVGELEYGNCYAHSVLLVGDGGSLEYDTECRALRLPQSLYRLDGVNNAVIIAKNIVCDNTTNQGVIFYDDLPTDGVYSISGLTIRCYGSSGGSADTVVGFCNCPRLSKCKVVCEDGMGDYYLDGLDRQSMVCKAYVNCTNLTECSCDIYAVSENVGFFNCAELFRCIAFCGCMGEFTPSENIGFSNCTRLLDCSAGILGASSNYYFTCCEQLSNCSCVSPYGGTYSDDASYYAFIDCNFTNGCKYSEAAGNIVGGFTETWSGTNAYRDDASCEVDI